MNELPLNSSRANRRPQVGTALHPSRVKSGFRWLALGACGPALLAGASAQGVLESSSYGLGKLTAPLGGGNSPTALAGDASPLRWGANSTVCQAEKLSSCVQPCHAVVTGHL